uniref:YhhN-like protein n=1 Tax=Panagrolaimus sp. JU765 TaxID=591449 RepID=A0AC34R8J8_9BILA
MMELSTSTFYFILVGAFFYEAGDFNRHDWTFSILKTLPCLGLATIVYLKHDLKNHGLGLVFSALGDLLIALGGRNLFIAGAAAFGIGHLFFMDGFVRKIKNIDRILASIVYGIGALLNIFFLIPELSTAPISTMILMVYSVILCTAVVLSGSLYFDGGKYSSPKQFENMLLFLGYLVFFTSDSLLLLLDVGINLPFHQHGILTTYFLSQYLILAGCAYKF